MMLEVVGVVDGVSGPEVSGDEFVPFMARWGLGSSVVWQAVWSDGRVCCELMLSDVGGRVNDLTILNAPSVVESHEGSASAAWEDFGVPAVSLEPFDPNPDLVPQAKLVKFVCSPRAVLSAEWLEVRLLERQVSRWVTSGAIGFGIDGSENVTSFRVSRLQLPSEGSLAFG